MDAALPPNIVFILTDDLDVGTFEQLPELKPYLQDQGLTFTNHFVSLSLCCPSRSSILRGQYAHNTGIFWNKGKNGGFHKFLTTGDERSTVGVWLQQQGYDTALIGKYLNGYPDDDDKKHIPPGWTEWISPMAGDPYGEFGYTMNEDGKRRHYGHSAKAYMGDVLDRKAVEFIDHEAQAKKPFFLYLATYAPHGPATPPPRYEGLYPDAKAPRGPAVGEDVGDKPSWLKSAPQLDDQKLAKADAAYAQRLRCMRGVVDLVRDVTAELEKQGLLDHTYIVFTSDNGFHFAEHRLNPGKNTEFDTDLRVPLVVRGPGIAAGTSTDAMSLNIDFAPTFAELAGATAPDWVDGTSLVPLLRGQAPPWRQAFLLEHRGPDPVDIGPLSGASRPAPTAKPTPLEPVDPGNEEHEPNGSFGVPVYVGLRTAKYTYLEYEDGERELYDLAADPNQLENLAASADPSLVNPLHEWLGRLRACKGADCRAAEQSPPAP